MRDSSSFYLSRFAVACAAILTLSLTACVSSDRPDLVRSEKKPGETHSPAEQFRALSAVQHMSGAYFLERGTVDDGIELLNTDKSGKQSDSDNKVDSALQDRVARLEQELQVRREKAGATAEVASKPKAEVQSATNSNAAPVAGTSEPAPVAVSSTSALEVSNEAAAETGNIDAVSESEKPKTLKERLLLLRELKDAGLIPEDQYQARVKAIIDQL